MRKAGRNLNARLAKLDLEPIKYNLISRLGWTLGRADRVEKMYKRFLLASHLHPSRVVVPTGDVDEMWHAHILDTRKYAEDCERVFREFIHHFPYLGSLGKENEAFLKDRFLANKGLYA